MNKQLYFLLWLIGTALLLYIAGAFITLSFDVTTWGEKMRGVGVIIFLTLVPFGTLTA